jgi:hypothetical protein
VNDAAACRTDRAEADVDMPARSYHNKRSSDSVQAARGDKGAVSSINTSPLAWQASESTLTGDGGLEMTHSRTSSMSTTAASHQVRVCYILWLNAVIHLLADAEKLLPGHSFSNVQTFLLGRDS